MDSPPIAAAELVRACLESGKEAAWAEFVRRFQPLIAASVTRVVRRYGYPSPALVDDLIQETYLRLCRSDARSLRDFQGEHDDAIFKYLKVIAMSVALDHFRARAAHKRRAEVENDGTNLEGSLSSFGIEQSTLVGQIETRLAMTETERDRTIFWLYYRQGYTAKEIAAMAPLGLTQKGVESCIHRLTQGLRASVGKITKGRSAGSTLGVVE